MVFFNGSIQVLRTEIRPQYIHKYIFGIGRLPQQKIAGPHLTGRTDDQFRIRYVRRIKVTVEDILNQILRLISALGHILVKAPGRPDDLIPPAVIQAKIHLDFMISLRAGLRLTAELLQFGRKTA